ncbi:Na+/H+ antiporter subunit E [Verrucomicrobiota bacterium sgz303538]
MHLLIAFVWLFLSGNTSLGGLVTGLVAGFLLLALFQRALQTQDYVRRVIAFIRFAMLFVREIVISNIRIAHMALYPKVGSIRGVFMAYNVEDLTKLETLLLCYCVSLTPGTTLAGKSEDERSIVLHAFASGTPEQISEHIDRTLRKYILAFTR